MKLRSAFTIVELLVVIVVIAILATITIVSYNGITKQATETAMKADLSAAAKVLELDAIKNGSYPDSAASADEGKGLRGTVGNAFSYRRTAKGYCVTVANASTDKHLQLRSDSGQISEGFCTPPTVSIQKSSGRTVTLAATKGYYDISSIEYRIGSGPWTTYTNEFTVPGTDAASIAARAFDTVGDSSTIAEASIPAASQFGAGWSLEVLSSAQSYMVGQTITGRGARLLDEAGNAVLNRNVTLSLNGATFSNGSTSMAATTNASGIAIADTIVPTGPGEVNLIATFEGRSVVGPTIMILAPSAELSAAVAVEPTLVGGKVSIITTATNTSAVPVTLRIVTRFGSRTFTGVEPGQTVTATIKTTISAIPSGEVEVRLTSELLGPLALNVLTVAYPAAP